MAGAGDHLRQAPHRARQAKAVQAEAQGGGQRIRCVAQCAGSTRSAGHRRRYVTGAVNPAEHFTRAGESRRERGRHLASRWS